MATITRGARPRLFLSAGWYALAMLAVALIAFWPVYVSKLPWGAEYWVNLHAAGVVLWMLFLVVQPWLIRRGGRALHRRIGKASYALVPFIIVSAVMLAHSRTAAMTPQAFAIDGNGLYLAFAATILFAACYALAIINRRDPWVHPRYMIATALPLIDPLTFRLLLFYSPLAPSAIVFPAIGYALTDLILLALAILDRNSPRGRGVFLKLLPAFVIVHIGWFTLGQTDLWLRLCAAFRDLPLTG
ncbi:MAG TPA: hypothetical protein VHM92_10695 [Allosphingosinicella sp.]|nr:hypothetical protein [Allosphingosinicella sp.]